MNIDIIVMTGSGAVPPELLRRLIMPIRYSSTVKKLIARHQRFVSFSEVWHTSFSVLI
jgi:hypothetical protein